ncbi:DUF1569 domain-containing protein [Allorhodopirellula heiligendammensis]|uniref:DUF1569 domain-containing protein n=1 Tax=Allorhodopirellula heiligendammensis TaxID=2714739 RepID=A0A5C6BEC7_9BACT|nr:DUF1569 domain-containing protein [Allorhodopirellula heiligendammensis]TWU10535.1 hypothetical protein Poly21_44400 [Allorhodopirellula heiligendammensis]
MADSNKRTLDFHTGDDVIAEIQRLRTGGYTKSKNWNLTQACEHLTATMTGGMDGFGFRLPWILRATIIKWVFHRILRTRKMSTGPTLKRLKPKTDDGPDDDTIIDNCIAVIERAKTFEGPIENYPFLDNLDVEDWRQFMWMHAGHHLGFLIPRVSAK